MKSKISIIVLIFAIIGISLIVDYFRRGRYRILKVAYIGIMSELDEHYLCGHSIYQMIHAKFFQRFGKINQEGFCYTVSAAVALSLKSFRRTRIVRGHIKDGDFETYHSWVEIFFVGRWWVVDPCLLEIGFIHRLYYYRELKPQVMVIYRYRQIWNDPAAMQFHKRLTRSETSRIFLNLYWHYTPVGKSVEIQHMHEEDTHLPEDNEYYLFPPCFGFKFSQRIVNELMARPTRMSPRRRTLRRLASDYKKIAVQRQNQTPA